MLSYGSGRCDSQRHSSRYNATYKRDRWTTNACQFGSGDRRLPVELGGVVPRVAYLGSRMIEKLAVCRVMRPFVTTNVSVPNLTLEAADSHAHSTYARSS